MIQILIIIASLFITIVVHESAHALMARLCGVKISEVALGFGKTIYKKKIKEITYKINILPIGGYCKFLGEKSKIKNGWLAAKYHQKVLISLAGVTANFILCSIIYLFVYKSISLGIFIDLQIINSILSKNYSNLIPFSNMINSNYFLLQLSIMNLFATIINLLPIPALDGGYPFLFLLEKKIKNFPLFLDRITKFGFVFLTILQIWLIYFIWFI